jgi:hypothetical protein
MAENHRLTGTGIDGKIFSVENISIRNINNRSAGGMPL